MNRFQQFLIACTVASLLAACATPIPQITAATEPTEPTHSLALRAVIAAPTRTEANRARDGYRHPYETLGFFGVTPTQTVVEVWPGLGWYTEILAPYLREQGRYVAAGFVVDTPNASKYFQKLTVKFTEKLAAEPALYDRVERAPLGMPDRYQPVAAGTADRVLTFRNVHNWLGSGNEREMFQAFFTALKSGGVLGVVEHRAAPGTSLEAMKKTGYVSEDLVIALATGAGFRLDARSEINANPRDSKDYAEGVWTLPPTLALGEQDKARYLAIGESDRMTLRFVKP